MDVSKEWYRSEFIQQELMDAHRDLEVELPFYAAIAEGNVEYVEKNCQEKAFVNPEGMGKLSENPIQNIRYHFVVTTALIPVAIPAFTVISGSKPVPIIIAPSNSLPCSQRYCLP